MVNTFLCYSGKFQKLHGKQTKCETHTKIRDMYSISAFLDLVPPSSDLQKNQILVKKRVGLLMEKDLRQKEGRHT